MLKPYVGLKVGYVSRKKLSRYTPCSLMMDYILHTINDELSDNFHFKRCCPDYHPYILRLYYGILFWVQCLRAAGEVGALDDDAHQFLMRFLDAYPPESLSISSPLLYLFLTLCASQPEFPTYGAVYPALPSTPGPQRRSDFIADSDSHDHFVIPHIPGIFALLRHLDSKMNPDSGNPDYPKKGKHIPVTSTANAAMVFGDHTFPIPAERSEFERWSLCSSGLQYPCEADSRLNQDFGECYSSYGFPQQTANDDLGSYGNYFCMGSDLSWFARVRDVAAIEAASFEGSGTLADCAPFGMMSNQICVEYMPPPLDLLPTAPSFSGDPAALFPFSVKMHTTARKLPELAEAMAALAQTHVRMFNSHPFLDTFGNHFGLGPFWSIRPIESSPVDESSYLSVYGIVRGLLKPKG